MTIEPERIQTHERKPGSNHKAPEGDYVLYWMMHSPRSRYNPALDTAIAEANELQLPLIALYVVHTDRPDTNWRHESFRISALSALKATLAKQGVPLIILSAQSAEECLETVAKACEHAGALVMDRGYLRHHRQWQAGLLDRVQLKVTAVEANIVVPVEVASDKREYAARTFRPKILDHLDNYLQRWQQSSLERTLSAGEAESLLPLGGKKPLSLDSLDLNTYLRRHHELDDSVHPVSQFESGEAAAGKVLEHFLRQRLDRYADDRLMLDDYCVAGISPYLHAGQLSPVEVAYRVSQCHSVAEKHREALIEELVVRRELAINFVWYEKDYAGFSMLPDWARETLSEHQNDERPHHYTRNELEDAQTHDPYWNAAMQQMKQEGYLHNNLRMYWGKKLLEWTNTPRYAHRIALYFNNRYFLDGRDPASFANVGWLFGLHDRAWQEREVIGKVRPLTARGMEQKYALKTWLEKQTGT